MTALVVPALASDGWEHAGAYHWMVGLASEGKLAVIMPGVLSEEDEITAYVLPATYLHGLRRVERHARAAAITGCAVAAHQFAEAQRG